MRASVQKRASKVLDSRQESTGNPIHDRHQAQEAALDGHMVMSAV